MACLDMEEALEARDEILEKLKNEANIGPLVVKQFDLSSIRSIRALAEKILEEESAINILVNNAGMATTSRQLTEDGFELQFGINYLGHYLLTLLLLPRILKSAPARIVNVASMGYLIGSLNFQDLQKFKSWRYSTWGSYSSSKLANILFNMELAKRLDGTGVTVYALHPGLMFTALYNCAEDFLFFNRRIATFLASIFLKNVELGAQTQIFCAVDESVSQQSGLFYVDCKPVDVLWKARDPVAAKRLWDMSWDLVKLANLDPFQPK